MVTKILTGAHVNENVHQLRNFKKGTPFGYIFEPSFANLNTIFNLRCESCEQMVLCSTKTSFLTALRCY